MTLSQKLVNGYNENEVLCNVVPDDPSQFIAIKPSNNGTGNIIGVGETLDYCVKVSEVDGQHGWGLILRTSDNKSIQFVDEPNTQNGAWGGVKKYSPAGGWIDVTNGTLPSSAYPLYIRVRACVNNRDDVTGPSFVMFEIKRNDEPNWTTLFEGQPGTDGDYITDLKLELYCRFKSTKFTSVRSMYDVMQIGAMGDFRKAEFGVSGLFLPHSYPATVFNKGRTVNGLVIETNFALDPVPNINGTIFSAGVEVGSNWPPFILNYISTGHSGLGTKNGLLLISMSSDDRGVDITNAAAGSAPTIDEAPGANRRWVVYELRDGERESLLNVRVTYHGGRWSMFVNHRRVATWLTSLTPHELPKLFSTMLCSRFNVNPLYRGKTGGIIGKVFIDSNAKPEAITDKVIQASFGTKLSNKAPARYGLTAAGNSAIFNPLTATSV